MYYLDTSALVKRYVSKPSSDIVDRIFSECYRGISRISFSYWNVAEAAVVFDKYERRLGLSAKRLMRDLLREMRTLARLHRLVVVDVSPKVLRGSVKVVLKHHIYVADALQIASATMARSSIFVTGDRDLAKVAEDEGLKVIYVG
ncbi:MAG: VapC toxin family PIN domain ribonuclease [Thermoprotei archaeon]|nr:MAG: VapC toxin family PIN domain ribonuclease [Thermoprotei archaeon]